MNLKSIFLITLFACGGIVQAQIDKGILTIGVKNSAEFKKSENHQYSLKLNEDQFAFLKLMQKGIDLKVNTYDSKGELLQEFDSPNFRNGYEFISISSQAKGTYIVEVESIDDDGHIGEYDIVLERVNAKAKSKEGKVDELFVEWDLDGGPGAAVAIVQGGEIVYKKGYGLANLEYNVANTPSTVFHIASISKQFTVFAILLLENEGKLSLDDDIRKFIPEVPDFGKKITLRHLASHTSGLRDQWNLLSMAGWRMDDVITKEHVLKLVSKQKDLNFDPGEEYTYCNTGFTLLAEVVSRVSEMSFADFTKANIFEPLGMESSLFYDDHEKIVKNRAYSYYSSSEGYKKSVLSYANVGATSLFTTVEDLSLWATNFDKMKIGNASIFDKMSTKAKLNNGDEFGGALGQFVGKYKGLNEIQHGGADAGYRTYLTRFPDEDLSVVVFSNAAEFNSGGMAHKIVDIYLEDRIEVPAPAEEQSQENDGVAVLPDEGLLKKYLGSYELQPGFAIKISLDDGRLFAQATGQPSLELIAKSNTEFAVEGIDAKLIFLPNDDGNVEKIKLFQGGQEMEASRVKDFDPDGVKLNEFTGQFYSEELSTVYTFTIVGDELVATHSRLNDFNLKPVKKDIFIGEAWFFGNVEFIRDSNGHIEACKVSNGRVRNLLFTKID